MADISTYIQQIQTAARGEEVRDAITDALAAINSITEDIPAPSASDSGKFLRVDSNGEWELAAVPSAEGVSF